jgi:hypothetical protein
LVLLLLLLLSPFYFLYRTVLRLAVELVWGVRGKRILMVYSRSPNWQRYIESTWLPRIGSYATVLNWSDRLLWTRQNVFASVVFWHWKPDHNFNPMIILFPAWRPVKRIGFYDAFRDLKHGKDHRLREAEAQLFGFVHSLGAGR